MSPISAEAYFKWVVADLHRRGLYPSPTLLNQRVHNRTSSNISGRESTWWRAMMHELGISLMRPKGSRAARRQMTGRPRAIEPKILCCTNIPGCRCCA